MNNGKKLISKALESDNNSKKISEDSDREKSSSEIRYKKKKKPKAVNLENHSDRSETSSKLGGPGVFKGKKVELMEVSDDQGDEKENPNALANFQISNTLKNALSSKGIQSLFPIQAMAFNIVLGVSELVGRARTGQSKTLAFMLPILESLVNGRAKALRKSGYGMLPSVLVLLPTRELAAQVFADFEVYGSALGLVSCCVYGGAPFQSQIINLKRGVHIIIGTPGRVKESYKFISYCHIA